MITPDSPVTCKRSDQGPILVMVHAGVTCWSWQTLHVIWHTRPSRTWPVTICSARQCARWGSCSIRSWSRWTYHPSSLPGPPLPSASSSQAWYLLKSDLSLSSRCPFSVSWPCIDMGSPKAGFASYTVFIFINPSRAAVSCGDHIIKHILTIITECSSIVSANFGPPPTPASAVSGFWLRSHLPHVILERSLTHSNTCDILAVSSSNFACSFFLLWFGGSSEKSSCGANPDRFWG